MSKSAAELHEFLRSRRSVRHYLERPVPPEVIDRILATAVQAPSAHNRQPWRFAVVSGEPFRAALAAAMGAAFETDLLADGLTAEDAAAQVARSRGRILTAPVVIVLCLSMADMDRYPDQRRHRAEFRMAMQSAALAGGQLLLAAHAEGLGGVWVCGPLFAPQAVATALDLPADWEPQGMFFIGYPDATRPSRRRARVPMAEVSLYR